MGKQDLWWGHDGLDSCWNEHIKCHFDLSSRVRSEEWMVERRKKVFFDLTCSLCAQRARSDHILNYSQFPYTKLLYWPKLLLAYCLSRYDLALVQLVQAQLFSISATNSAYAQTYILYVQSMNMRELVWQQKGGFWDLAFFFKWVFDIYVV